MSELFNCNKYVKVENLIDERTIQTISQYLENKIKAGEWLPKSKEDKEAKGSSRFGYYGDPLLEIILKECTPLIEDQTGLELEPTCSFARIYQGGEQLTAHVDRPSCEITATVNVACTGEIWPIWMQNENNDPAKFLLNPGDAVIYKGCEVMHWRRKLPEGQVNVQFMLHYIDKNGPHTEYKFDRRASLGSMPV
jgi:hypothetical protein